MRILTAGATAHHFEGAGKSAMRGDDGLEERFHLTMVYVHSGTARYRIDALNLNHRL